MLVGERAVGDGRGEHAGPLEASRYSGVWSRVSAGEQKIKPGHKEGDPETTFTYLTIVWDSPQLRFLNINVWILWKASPSALIRIILIFKVKITVISTISIHEELTVDG